MKERSRRACGSQRYVVIFPTGPATSLASEPMLDCVLVANLSFSPFATSERFKDGRWLRLPGFELHLHS